MSQQAGAPFLGDTPGFAIDTSLGTAIERYHLIQISENTSTANNMMVGLCATNSTGRGLAIGTAFTGWQYPPDPRIYEPSGQLSTDISSQYDAAKKQTLAVRLEGTTWAKVQIASGGSSITLSPGGRLVPSALIPGCVDLIAAPTMTAATDSTTIVAAYAVDEAEQNAVIGKAMSLIHVPASGASWGSRPSLQGSLAALTLTALTNAVTFGYVFTKLGKW